MRQSERELVSGLYNLVSAVRLGQTHFYQTLLSLLTQDAAEDNPTCSVIGTDLSSIQPLSWMPNCQFVQENSELQDWLFPHKFDYSK